MNSKKIAFICPTHTYHFNFVKALLCSFKIHHFDFQSDLWLVFSNDEESEHFGNYECKLVLPEELHIVENGGIVNIKKLWAIKKLQKNYEYLIIIDSETLFIRPVNLLSICKHYFYTKILLGNQIRPDGKELTDNIKSKCKEFFPLNQQSFLSSDLYLWFNQPCIYKTSNLDTFFEITQLDDKLEFINWYHFDYYIYMYFLILYEKFTVEDMEIESSYGVCEATNPPFLIKTEKYTKLSVLLSSLFNLKRFNNSKLFLLIHIDRI